MHLRRGFCLLVLLLSASLVMGQGFPTLLKTLNTGNYPESLVVFGNNIAVANALDNTITVFVGSCSAYPVCSYTAKGPWPVGAGPTSIDKGHFRGAGSPVDLVTANNSDNTVSVLLNMGGGKFQAGPGVAVDGAFNPMTVVVGDFNDDGYDDIAVTDFVGPTRYPSVPSVTVLLNDKNCTYPAACNPTFGTQTSYTLPGSSVAWGMAKGRFKLAGARDLVAANFYGASEAGVLLNSRMFAPWTGFGAPAAVGPRGFYTPYVATGHFHNGTNKDDFAITGFAGAVNIFTNNGSGIFTLSSNPSAGPWPEGIVNAGDLDGDGLDDLVVTNFTTGQITTLYSLGGYTPPVTTSVGTSASYPYAVVVDKLGALVPLVAVVNRGDNKLKIYGP